MHLGVAVYEGDTLGSLEAIKATFDSFRTDDRKTFAAFVEQVGVKAEWLQMLD